MLAACSCLASTLGAVATGLAWIVGVIYFLVVVTGTAAAFVGGGFGLAFSAGCATAGVAMLAGATLLWLPETST